MDDATPLSVCIWCHGPGPEPATSVLCGFEYMSSCLSERCGVVVVVSVGGGEPPPPPESGVTVPRDLGDHPLSAHSRCGVLVAVR